MSRNICINLLPRFPSLRCLQAYLKAGFSNFLVASLSKGPLAVTMTALQYALETKPNSSNSSTSQIIAHHSGASGSASGTMFIKRAPWIVTLATTCIQKKIRSKKWETSLHSQSMSSCARSSGRSYSTCVTQQLQIPLPSGSPARKFT